MWNDWKLMERIQFSDYLSLTIMQSLLLVTVLVLSVDSIMFHLEPNGK